MAGGDFQHGLFGCFDNCFVCVVTYFFPCYTAGKVAESVGKSCCCHALLFIFCPCVSLFTMMCVRTEIREQRSISGSGCGDFCVTLWCTSCALCQEAMEMNAMGGSMAEDQTIERQ